MGNFRAKEKKTRVLNIELMNKLEVVGIRIDLLKTEFLKWRKSLG